MKLTALFLTAGNFVSAKSERGLMWLGERYIYDDPLCEDISYCRGEKGKGKIPGSKLGICIFFLLKTVI